MSWYPHHPWLVALLDGILEGNRAVDAIFEYHPFGGVAPLAVRVDLYDYEFARREGVWWERKHVGEYVPTLQRGNPTMEQFLRQHALKA
jgi:hypothetical protein